MNGSHHGGVAAERDAKAEEVTGLSVGRGELRDLAPVAGATVVTLVDVRSSGVFAVRVLAKGAYDRGVAAEGAAEAEIVADLGIGGRELPDFAKRTCLSTVRQCEC